jgi:hypothetical protein
MPILMGDILQGAAMICRYRFDNRRQLSKGPTLVWRSLLDGLADGVDVFLHGRLCAAVTKSSTGAAAICGRGGVKSSQW